MSIVTTKPDLKRIVEGVLLSLDLDYSVFDIAEGTDPGQWMVTFFDRYRTGGQSIFARISDMAVVPYQQDQAPRLDFGAPT